MSFDSLTYQKILDRIYRNVGVDEKTNSSHIVEAKQDVADVIVEMYSNAELPLQRYYKKLTKEVVSSTEDFSDTTYIEKMVVSDISIDSGKGKASSGTNGNITYSNADSIKYGVKQVDLKAYFTSTGGSPTGNITVAITQNGSEVYSSTEELTSIETEYVFSPNLEGIEGFSVSITLSGTDANVFIDDLYFTGYFSGFALPSDFYLPREVLFKNADNNDLLSKEVTPEEYIRWIPSRNYPTESFSQIVERTDIEETLIAYTDENIYYDGTIGYYFGLGKNEGNFIFKPRLEGSVEIVYVSLPTFSVSEENTAEVQRVFVDIIVLSCSIRMLVRRLKEAKSEIQFVGIRGQISEYKSLLEPKMKQFISYMNRRANTTYIEPWAFLDDPDYTRGDMR